MKKIVLICALVVVVLGGIYAFMHTGNKETPQESSVYTPEIPGSLILVNLTIADLYPAKTIAIAEGSTVLQLLETASDNDKFAIYVENETVKSIKGKPADGENAPSSWTYKVNGKTPSVPMNSHILSDGDNVEILYAPNL